MSFPYWPGAPPGGGGETQNLSYDSTKQTISLTGSTPSTIQLENVYQVVAGNNITLNPPSGQGVVTINAATTGVGSPDAIVSTLIARDYVEGAVIYASSLRAAGAADYVEISNPLAFDYQTTSSITQGVTSVNTIDAPSGQQMLAFREVDDETQTVWANLGVGRIYVAGNNTVGIEKAPYLWADTSSHMNAKATQFNTDFISSGQVGSASASISSIGVSSISGGSLAMSSASVSSFAVSSIVGGNVAMSSGSFNSGSISSLTVSSINGLPPGGGGEIPANINVSSIFVNEPGAVTLATGVGDTQATLEFNTTADGQEGFLARWRNNQSGEVQMFGKTLQFAAFSTNTLQGTAPLTCKAINLKSVNDAAASGVIADNGSGQIYLTGVSSINGAVPGGGGAYNPNPAFSTITLPPGGYITAPSGFFIETSSIGASLRIDNTSTSAVYDITLATKVPANSIVPSFSGDMNYIDISAPGGLTTMYMGTTDNNGVFIYPKANASGGFSTLSVYSDGNVNVLAPTSISSLTVSSINGLTPGGSGSIPTAGISTNQVAAATNGLLVLAADDTTKMTLDNTKGGAVEITAGSGSGTIQLNAHSTIVQFDLNVSSINGQAPNGGGGGNVSSIINLSSINSGTPGIVNLLGSLQVSDYLGASAISTNTINLLDGTQPFVINDGFFPSTNVAINMTTAGQAQLALNPYGANVSSFYITAAGNTTTIEQTNTGNISLKAPGGVYISTLFVQDYNGGVFVSPTDLSTASVSTNVLVAPDVRKLSSINGEQFAQTPVLVGTNWYGQSWIAQGQGHFRGVFNFPPQTGGTFASTIPLQADVGFVQPLEMVGFVQTRDYNVGAMTQISVGFPDPSTIAISGTVTGTISSFNVYVTGRANSIVL